MRALFTVSAWAGHHYPLVPLGWALQAAGHEVRVACAPSQENPLRHTGLTPVPVLGEIDMGFLARLKNLRNAQEGSWPYAGLPPHPVTGAAMRNTNEFSFPKEIVPRYVSPLRASFAAAVDFGDRWRPDLVIHELLSLEGLLAARVLGVPSVLHLWGPVGTHEDPGLELTPHDHTGAFREYGVGTLGPDLVRHVIDPCPGALRPALGAGIERLPMRYVPYNGTGAMQDWLLEPPVRPRICVLWGNSPRKMVGPRGFVLPEVVEAVAGLDAEVVLAASAEDATELGTLPPGVHLLTDFPLHQLLPGCSAVVHHGGAGALMTSLVAGVPQLVLPHAMDQFLNAGRIAASGAALTISGAEVTVAGVREATARLLREPSYGVAARALQHEAQSMPSPVDVVAALAQLASR